MVRLSCRKPRVVKTCKGSRVVVGRSQGFVRLLGYEVREAE